MSHGWVDYRAVKANVSMEMALATYGIHLHRLDRVYLRGRCPLPTHQSRTSLQSFIVNIGEERLGVPLRVVCRPARRADWRQCARFHCLDGTVVLFATRPLGCASGSR